jgi:DNA polymerase elongation subunit (family B)
MLEHIDLSQVLVIDIETVPQFPSFDEVPPPLAGLWEQKTAYQRKETVTAGEYYTRAGIWAEFGKIICISAGSFSFNAGITGLKLRSFFDDDEPRLLQRFISLLSKQPSTLLLCAHNGKEFDFPYLCRRMLINGIALPPQLHLWGKKPWEIPHIDTMELWKFGDYKQFTSLNLLAEIFGIPTPKDDISGEDVYRVYWQENDLGRIRKYCEKDVITTAQVLLRFKNMPPVPEHLITVVA